MHALGLWQREKHYLLFHIFLFFSHANETQAFIRFPQQCEYTTQCRSSSFILKKKIQKKIESERNQSKIQFMFCLMILHVYLSVCFSTYSKKGDAFASFAVSSRSTNSVTSWGRAMNDCRFVHMLPIGLFSCIVHNFLYDEAHLIMPKIKYLTYPILCGTLLADPINIGQGGTLCVKVDQDVMYLGRCVFSGE
jgi:hypothetical protein